MLSHDLLYQIATADDDSINWKEAYVSKWEQCRAALLELAKARAENEELAVPIEEVILSRANEVSAEFAGTAVCYSIELWDNESTHKHSIWVSALNNHYTGDSYDKAFDNARKAWALRKGQHLVEDKPAPESTASLVEDAKNFPF